MDFLQLLPTDIIFNHILNLLDVATRLRATLVCRAWRDLVREAPSISNMPWLFLFDLADPIRPPNLYPDKYYLLDLEVTPSSTTRYCNYRPPLCDNVIGSGCSYLTLPLCKRTINDEILNYQYNIYHPITRKTIRLPSWYPSEYIRPGRLQFANVQFSSNPPDCLVAAWHEYGIPAIYFCRPGKVMHDWVEGPELSSRMRDLIFYKGQIYGIDDDYISAYDINLQNYESSSLITPRRIASSCHHYVLSDRHVADFYLVQSDKELLVVTHTYSGPDYDMSRFMVHRVDEEKGELVEVLDLGERMLFLHQGGSMSRSGPDLYSDRFFTNNSIYFFQIKWHYCKRLIFVGKFKLGTSSPQFHPTYRFNNWPKWVSPPNPKN